MTTAHDNNNSSDNNVSHVNSDNSVLKNAVELALLTAGQPLDLRTLQNMLDHSEGSEGQEETHGEQAKVDAISRALAEIGEEWRPRALNLIKSASGYQFISKPDYLPHLRRLYPERPPRLSRALLEVLSVIAYRQPVTRGDIEQIRGVAVSSAHIAFLEEQGWIEEVGRRESPGRPLLYATTNVFLDDLGLASLNELPPLPNIEEDNVEEAVQKDDEQKESPDASTLV